ncbi:hypothetical protein EJB05_21571, partial [Eragrostis curvula]
MSQRMRAASGASSSSHARTVLPLIDCPQCFIPIIRLVSRQPETYGPVFYKCENNSKVDPFSCHFSSLKRAMSDIYATKTCYHRSREEMVGNFILPLLMTPKIKAACVVHWRT